MSRVSDFFVKAAATFFGVGYARRAPGTFGSLAGLALAAFLGAWLLPALIFLLIVGYAICRPAVRVFSSGDPSRFVLDEVCGMMIGASVYPKTPLWYLAAFALFRFFDILKPWPISKVQGMKHPSAIMSDDVLAGVFTAALGFLAMAAIYRLTGGGPASLGGTYS